jgi:hypothetical protein
MCFAGCCIRTSENSVEANLAQFPLHELRRCSSELHTSQDRKRKVWFFEPSRGFDTPLSMPLKNPLIPLPILIHDAVSHSKPP